MAAIVPYRARSGTSIIRSIHHDDAICFDHIDDCRDGRCHKGARGR
jgi:hypothetical protein